ncbi:MAG TPA: CoB--CoM heterodisulfide reductase iron-sulfur subunit B family protein [Burkholderiales bacterium]
MAKKEYAFYPGCSSQLKASASNYLVSVNAMCEKLDIRMTEIPDWNCCGASVGYGEGGELPRLAISARNFALAEQHLPGQDIVATCAACWLASREAIERLDASAQLMNETNEALAAAGLSYRGEVKARHMVEVLIEDLGYEELGRPVVKPLEGLKIAGYVGCQTNRPFGIAGESFENPLYLDKLVETLGGQSLPKYEQKVTCCGGALAFSEPEKSQKQIRDIVEAAYDHGADLIVTPCPLCQANVEVYQSEINRKQGTRFAMPVTYYSQLMTVTYGGTPKEAGLDGHVIPTGRLEEIARK